MPGCPRKDSLPLQAVSSSRNTEIPTKYQEGVLKEHLCRCHSDCMRLVVVLAGLVCLPVFLLAAPAVQLDFSAAKNRVDRNKKGNTTKEGWIYKVDVGNRSFRDFSALEFKYRIWISSENRVGNRRKESSRVVTGSQKIEDFANATRISFATKRIALQQVEKVERKKTGGKNKPGNKQKSRTIVTRDTQKLDGLAIDVFHQGKKIAQWHYGSKAK